MKLKKNNRCSFFESQWSFKSASAGVKAWSWKGNKYLITKDDWFWPCTKASNVVNELNRKLQCFNKWYFQINHKTTGSLFFKAKFGSRVYSASFITLPVWGFISIEVLWKPFHTMASAATMPTNQSGTKPNLVAKFWQPTLVSSLWYM